MRFAHLDEDKLPPIRRQGTPIEKEKWGFEKFQFLASKALFFAAAVLSGYRAMVPSGGTVLGGKRPVYRFIWYSDPFNARATLPTNLHIL
jgi:hypothetical protein